MSYNATVFNVMITSPGDVSLERAIIREVIHEWNGVHSFSKKIVLLPIGWDTHSSPDMAEKGQKVINKQVLDKGDLLVGVFWTRVGTPTDDYLSGTIEEIERHMSAGKPTMIYFSSAPVIYESVDSEQYKALVEFKTSIKSRGLYQDYNSPADFKEKFYRQLQLKVNEHEMFTASVVEKLPSKISESRIAVPKLSTEAKILLKEASQDENGQLLHLHVMEGMSIQTNNKEFIPDDSPRETAKWQHALDQLETNQYLRRQGNGQILLITELGYQVADLV